MKTFFIIFLLFPLISITQVIRGKVVDSQNNPLAGANIFIPELKRGIFSNERGFFEIEVHYSGKLSINVSFLGYVSQSKTLLVREGETNQISFILEKQTFNPGEVIIEANRKSDLSIQSPGKIHIINAKKIEQSSSLSIPSVLTSLSGVDVRTDFGMFSSKSVVSLRGLGGGNQTGTLVLLDGCPINKSDAGSVNWNMIDKDIIEEIEIVKGPASILFGSNAMGGIINFITKRPEEKFGGKITAQYGTYNTFNQKVLLTGRSQNGILYGRIIANHKKSDGYINTPDYIIKENDTIVVPVFFDEYMYSAMLGFQPDIKDKIELTINYFDDIRGNGVKIYEDKGAVTHHDTWHGIGRYHKEVGKSVFDFNFFYLEEDYNRLDEYYSMSEYKLYEVVSKRKEIGFRASGISEKDSIYRFTYGFDYKNGCVDGADIYYSSTDLIRNKGNIGIFGAFFQSEFYFLNNKLSITPGIRYDISVFNNGSFSIEDPSYMIEYLVDYQFFDLPKETYSGLSPKLNINYKIDSKTLLYFSLGKGFRAPLLEDLCRTGKRKTGFKIANPELKPEYIFNYEVGINYKTEKLKASFSTYFMDGRDFMYFLSTGDSVNLGYSIVPVYRMENISEVRIFGLETDFELEMNRLLSFSANYTYNSSVISNFIKKSPADFNLEGKYLVDIPFHKGAAGLILRTKFVNFSIKAVYTGSRYINEENNIDVTYFKSDKYPSFYTLDAKLSKTINSFKIDLECENIFNEIYVNRSGYRSPGRIIMVSVTYSINNKNNKK
ncbi:MAG: TonB-dependent receptor [Bacteroidales bacterium]|nr:TonB-dependent receptor [Bacteroidales bacterium]